MNSKYLAVAATLLIVLCTGCSTLMSAAVSNAYRTPPDTFLASDKKDSIRTIRVAFMGAPELAMHSFDQEQRDKTASGVMVGAGAGVDAAIGTAGPFGLFLLPLTVPLGALIGGVSAGASAVPSARAEEIIAIVLPALSDFPFEESMVEQIITAGTGRTAYRFLSAYADGAADRPLEEGDTTLEVTLQNVGLSKVEKGLQLVAVVHARLVDKETGASLAVQTFSRAWRIFGRDKPKAGDELLTREEIDGCISALSQDMVDSLFLMEYLPQLFCEGVSGPPMFRYSEALLPRNPKPDWDFFGTKYRSGKVDSLHPTLEWAAFPSKRDKETDTLGTLKGIENVWYDLRIWRLAEEVQHPPELVYERESLVDPRHTIVQPLENGKTYYWAVRARFVRDGHLTVSQWTTSPGVLSLITRDGTTTGGGFFSQLSGLYRFSTPAASR